MRDTCKIINVSWRPLTLFANEYETFSLEYVAMSTLSMIIILISAPLNTPHHSKVLPAAGPEE